MMHARDALIESNSHETDEELGKFVLGLNFKRSLFIPIMVFYSTMLAQEWGASLNLLQGRGKAVINR